MRLVLDASVAVRVVLRLDGAGALIGWLEQASLVISPALIQAEVANALWKYVRAGDLAEAVALARLDEAMALIDVKVPDGELITEALAAACREGHPVYDLLYAVLARRHACAVLTRDGRLTTLLGKLGIPAIGVP